MRRSIVLLAGFSSLFAADPVQLFNGKDLSGWTMVGPGRFIIENGVLKTEGGMGLLYYNRQKFGNQTIRVVFKTSGERDNSGVYIRMPEPPPDPWYGVHNGYEVQIAAGGDDWHSTGSLYSLAKVSKRASKPAGEWNIMDIQLDGQTTRITLNGEFINEFEGDQPVPDRKQWYEPVRGPRPDSGYIGLQNHDARSQMYFKEISVIGGSTIAQETLAGPLSQGDRDRILSYYHSTRKQVLDAVSRLSEAQWNFKPADNKWSIRDVVEHLVLSEEAIPQFATAGLRKSAPKPETKIADEKFVAMMKDRSKSAQAPEVLKPSGKWPTTAALVSEFQARRDKNLAWLRGTQDELRGTFTKFSIGVVDTYQALLLVPAHTERHLAQIEEVKSSAGYPK